MIRSNSESLLRLVNQMLDLSRLEAGALPLNMVQSDIIAWLRTVMELFQSQAMLKEIQLSFLPQQEEYRMDFDPDRIRDIVGNLLSNAIKFTPEGGQVSLYAGAEDGRFHLRVEDTGPGIAPEQLPHIFERFYQADDSPTRRAEGTGIGLALTRELARLFGGEITAASRPEEGSVFRLWLPVTRKAPVTESLPALTGSGEQGAARGPERPGGQSGLPGGSALEGEQQPAKIKSLPLALIVEDNADVVTYLKSCLQSRYQLEVAANGREGIEKAIELVPDVIVSDVMMPEADGFELCRTLKEDQRSSHIPIVLLTALGDMPHRLEGLETGADAYLVKPFNEQELELSLRKSLELRRRLQARYAQGTVPAGQPELAFSRDDAFVAALNELLEGRYEDDRFNVGLMAQGMMVSERQLLRKVSALFGLSPSEYLRRFRLKKAYFMLLNTDLGIAEICFATGFKDPAHFSNLFLEEYKVRPSELRRR
jgi:DNA-binding response OmpR family regulator